MINIIHFQLFFLVQDDICIKYSSSESSISSSVDTSEMSSINITAGFVPL